MLEHSANPSNSLSRSVKSKPYKICNLGMHLHCINKFVSEIPWLKIMFKNITFEVPNPLNLWGTIWLVASH